VYDNIVLDTKELDKLIADIKGRIPKIAKYMIAAAADKAKQDEKKITPVRTGKLKRSIDKYAFNDWGVQLTTRRKKEGRSGWYGSFIEKGATRTARNAKYLTFKINGEWKKVASTTSPPKPFLRPVFDDYFIANNGAKARKIMDEKLQKELDKLNGGDK
jgi:hypothetical protein